MFEKNEKNSFQRVFRGSERSGCDGTLSENRRLLRRGISQIAQGLNSRGLRKGWEKGECSHRESFARTLEGPGGGTLVKKQPGNSGLSADERQGQRTRSHFWSRDGGKKKYRRAPGGGPGIGAVWLSIKRGLDVS